MVQNKHQPNKSNDSIADTSTKEKLDKDGA